MELTVKDKITQKLAPLLKEAAGKLLEAQREHRFVVLRYHNDADGISGALALTSFLNCKAIQQNSAIYSAKDANYDLEAFSSHKNAILVLVDFGASAEGISALELVRAAGIEIIIIDHHPPAEGIEKSVSLFASPWAINNDETNSRYPAGYLCAEIAKFAGKDCIEYALIACVGDKSNILETTQAHKDKAAVLDYLALFHKRGNLLLYESALRDEYLMKSTLAEAREKTSAIVSMLMKGAASRKFGKLGVFTINMEKMFENFDFPSRGKIITLVSEELEKQHEGEAMLVIGYGQRAVMLRLNDKALEIGCDAREIMEKLKSTMKDFVENAGGHAKASAARVQLGYAKSASEEIVRMIEEKFSL